MMSPTARQGLSERQYAARICVSHTAVQKARKAGRLALHTDGSIDPERSDRRRVAETDPAQTHGQAHAGMKPITAAAVGAVNEALREQGLAGEPAAGGGPSFASARTANEVMKAQERRLRLQKMRGETVDRARATALVFRLARQERDAWLGWPARVAALMAAEVGISAHAMQTILERHVRDQLAQLAEVKPEFR